MNANKRVLETNVQDVPSYDADLRTRIGSWELLRPLAGVILAVMALLFAIQLTALLPGYSLDGPLRSGRVLALFALIFQALHLWVVYGFRLRWWDVMAAFVIPAFVSFLVYPGWTREILLSLCLPISVSAVFAAILSSRNRTRSPVSAHF